jgi:glucose/arabinose dehydrogenase
MKRALLIALFAALPPVLPAAAIAGEAPGQHFEILPSQLAQPYATPASQGRVVEIERPANARLSLPQGFQSNLFAEGLSHARWMTVAGNGDVFLAEPEAGKITLLRDANNDGRAESATTFADGYQRPHGLAIRDGALYVGDARGVWRIPYRQGETRAAQAGVMITQPGAFGAARGHWTRNLAFSPSGELFVSIGSAGNIAEEEPPRATIQQLVNGRLVTFATGLRNPVGIAFYPGTNDLYTVVNERDGLGDDLVPDYLTRVERGAFYGWPYAYIGAHPDPTLGAKRPDLVRSAKVPDVLFQAHSASLGLLFYTGTQFPAAYRGGAFVSFHGSWNSSRPTGYKVVYVPFRNNRPAGGYDNFALGFRTGGVNRADVIGRPVGLAQARDGSLLIADDVGQAVWRVSYGGQ